MFVATVPKLRCPRRSQKRARGLSALCGSDLQLRALATVGSGAAADVISGRLECPACRASFPILGGVAVLVQDVRGYLLEHVKGLSQAVPEDQWPREHLRELKAARDGIQAGHIEDDLESERVISLYLMNHYLDTRGEAWWLPRCGKGDPLIDSLVRTHWDQGPLYRIGQWARAFSPGCRVVELGCGVGGLAPRLAGKASSYLGVDSSLAAIALARHLALGAPYLGRVRIPEDLLQGPVSRELPSLAPSLALDPGDAAATSGEFDFVVGDLQALPVAPQAWEVSVALNAIDMLEEPSVLPQAQAALLVDQGLAIQSCPYIWHEAVARKLRARLPRLPKRAQDSAGAALWLYRQAGFEIEEQLDHVPWLFFKHVRQLELYSVHLFKARLSRDG